MTVSPLTPSAWVLVARIRSDGASRRTASASTAQASRRCSQLSRTSNNRLEATYSINRDTGHWLDSSRSPSEIMTVFVTSSASSRPASSTSHTPSGMPRRRSAADLRASRVLPTPPVPTSVTRRAAARADLISCSWRRRPTKVVNSAGRFPRIAVGLDIVRLLRASVARSVTATPSVTATGSGPRLMDRAPRRHESTGGDRARPTGLALDT